MRSQKGVFYLNVSICVDTKTWFECFIDATWHSVVKKYMRSDIIAWWHWWQSAFWTGSMSRTVRNEPVLGNESDFASLSVTYVSRVPWRREQRCHVPSLRLLYHRWAAELLARLLGGKPGLRGTCCLFTIDCDQSSWMQSSHALTHIVYTRSRLVSQSEMPILRSLTWRFHSLLQERR